MPRKNAIFRIGLGVLCTILLACDGTTFYREHIAIPDKLWSNNFNPRFQVSIGPDESKCQVNITVRHTPNYKYSNLFLLLKETYPGGKSKTYSIEIPLTSSDGRWLGEGSGSILTCQTTIFKKHEYNEEGTFSYEIFQNMKENPLPEITDIGLEVQPIR